MIITRKYKFLICAIVVIVSACNAQNKVTNLQIKILDEQKEGLPQSYLEISNKDTIIKQQTGLDGLLELKNFKKGEYKISVSVVGYYKLNDYPISLIKEQEFLNIEMKPVQNLNTPNILWEGGWVTYEDKDGKIKSIKTKEK